MVSQKKRKIGFVHFASTISMSLVLFLIGLVCMLLLVGRDMSRYVKENINLSVILDDGIEKQDEMRIEKFLNNAGYAKSVEYISKSAALKDHISNLGDNPQEFLGYNPLKASVEAKLHEKYANPDSVRVIENKLKMFECIDRVVYQKEMVSLVNDNVRRVSYVLIGLAFVLLIVSMALINNTIRLSLYSNRFLIHTMKLVGATPGFIRKPYLLRMMFNGIIASVIAVALLVGVVMFVQTQFGIPYLLLPTQNLVIAGAVVLIISVVLTTISSYMSVRRFLRLSSNDLHSI